MQTIGYGQEKHDSEVDKSEPPVPEAPAEGGEGAP
jgi:hypothetical protein